MKPTEEHVLIEETITVAAPVDVAKEAILEREGVTTPLSPGAAPETLSPQTVAILAAMQQQMLTAVAEMKKPSAEEQEKLDAAKARRLNNAKQTAFQIQEGERKIANMQKTCDHAMPNGKSLWRGQMNSDGCYRPFCVKCHYESKPIRGDQFRLNNEPINLYKLDAGQLTIAKLEAMAAASLPPLPVSALPSGAEVDLASF